MMPAQLTAVGVGIRNVLIATDFSQYSKAALDFGLELGPTYRAHCYIAFVVPSNEFLLAGPEAYVAAREAARRDLLQLRAELRQTHPAMEREDYELFLLEGEIAQSLLEFASQKDADLIVVGTHGRSGLGKMLIGSIAERVFRQSPVPVLTVGPNLHGLPAGLATRKILVPSDFSPASRATQYACGLAQEHEAQVTMLHVLDAGSYKHEADRQRVMPEIEKKLARQICENSCQLNVCYRTEVGKVVPSILGVASEIGADLLVMGVRPCTGLFDRVLWPHAYAVVREAPCAVLTVRGTTKRK